VLSPVSNLNGLKTLLEDLDANLIRGLGHGDLVEDTIAEIDAQLAMVVQ
jgi:hypothetical protein